VEERGENGLCLAVRGTVLVFLSESQLQLGGKVFHFHPSTIDFIIIIAITPIL
jgi:hypothetical protein